jgi:tetratricopeptide (TPR) repeat protein
MITEVRNNYFGFFKTYVQTVAGLTMNRFLRITGWIILLTVFALSAANSNADRASSANKKGIEAFDNQNFEKSVEQFTEALVDRPDSPELKYNRGTALSMLNKTDEALKELLSAASGLEKGTQSASAHFNAANTLFTANNLEAAIEEYKEAIKLDQVSEDFRHNLELAVRRLNRQQQEQDQQQNQEKEKQENGEDETKQDKKEQEEEKQQEEEEKQSDQTQDPEDGEQKDQNQQPSQQQDNEVMPMTPEDAQRLLDAINDEEKKALSQRYMQMKTNMRPGDDW